MQQNMIRCFCPRGLFQKYHPQDQRNNDNRLGMFMARCSIFTSILYFAKGKGFALLPVLRAVLFFLFSRFMHVERFGKSQSSQRFFVGGLMPRLFVSLMIILFAGVLLGTASPVFAWETQVVDGATTPQQLIVVDKKEQQLYIYKRESPLRLDSSYACTTGQKTGDKLLSGDLRTPEGIYFVVGKIHQKLDFEEYGNDAYALNYPNPVDKLRGKTGYGIWIHSRGRPITPLETRGCIAVDLPDMDKLASNLAPGTAVVVANNIASDAASPIQVADSTEQLIFQKTREWNRAWSDRSADLFDFYAPDEYSRAQGESFNQFKKQKEFYFSTLPWIHILHGDIRVLRGPNYWVSWFTQHYRAPNTISEGVRRLYWQEDESGQLRIIGMEWLPEELGLTATYLEKITPSITQFIEKWRQAWEQGDLTTYMAAYRDNAVQGKRVGADVIKEHKVQIWKKRAPAKVVLSGLRIMPEKNGVSVDMMQEYKDASGYQDKGIKKILLHPVGDTWVIATEDWTQETS